MLRNLDRTTARNTRHSSNILFFMNKRITKAHSSVTRFKTISVNGLDLFYREAGAPGKPVILLMHGYPSSSHMYRDLLRDLANDYHLIAPDYPGFGNSSMPDKSTYRYTFENLSRTIEDFIDAFGLKRFALYMQDYGAPIGYRIATRRPELIKALLIQNGNCYVEGLGPDTADGKRFWANRNEETETAVKQAMTFEGTRYQYLQGANDPLKISPDAYLYDQYFLDRPGNIDIQLELLYDYRTNIALYPAWQAWLREHQPPTLITWGRNDPFFTAEGAKAYLKDLPNAELHLIESGHFALEECHIEIAELIHSFLQRTINASKQKS